jgi:protein-tyrosine phosphatase
MQLQRWGCIFFLYFTQLKQNMRKNKIDFSSILLPTGQTLYLSSRPGYPSENFDDPNMVIASFMDAMKDKQIRFIVVLLETEKMMEYYGLNLVDTYIRNGFQVQHFPIIDNSIPQCNQMKDFDSLEQEIWDHVKKDNVLIHCAGGCGRTGIVAAGLLIKVRIARSSEEAIRKVREVRKCSVENDIQEWFLEKYHKFLKKKTEWADT